MRYLNPQEIIEIHKKIMDETEGFYEARNKSDLESLTEAVKQKIGGSEIYRGLFKKAAFYLKAPQDRHIFIDGNKRIGLAMAYHFLFLNGYKLIVDNDEAERFMVEVAQNNIELEEIADWLRENSEQIEED